MNNSRNLFCSFAAAAGIALVSLSSVSAQDNPAASPSPSTVAVSPKAPWTDVPPAVKLPAETPAESSPWWQQALLWIPNRLADFIDIFRIDLGVGPSVGGVVRVTKYGQLGYRMMVPASVRVGDFGRRAPIMVEHSNEFGVGPLYVNSSDRTVCTGEVGAGLDLVIVGGYGGVCFEEVADFVAGLFFLDLRDDDWQ